MAISNLKFHNGGYCVQLNRLTGARSWKSRKFQAVFLSFDHSKYGRCLIDTGYGPLIRKMQMTFKGRLFNTLLPIPNGQPFEDAEYPAKYHGLDVDKIQKVFVSHFHADHIGGVSLFPRSTFVTRTVDLHRLAKSKGIEQLKHGFFPELLPSWFGQQLEPLPKLSEWNLTEFEFASLDFFQDGSLILLDMPGHALGHTGYLIEDSDGNKTLYATDAFWTLEAWQAGGHLPYLVRGVVHDYPKFIETQSRLKRLSDKLGLLPLACHCNRTQERVLPNA